MTKLDFHYKWSKIFAAKRFGGKQMILDALEQQELLDDAKRIDVSSSAILPRGEDDYESLIKNK